MSNLFRKAAIYTDLHLGRKSNNLVFNQDCLEYTKWFIKTAKENDCDMAIFLGDFHDNRSSLNLQTLDFSLQCLQLLNDAFPRTLLISGNHDLYLKSSRSISSIAWANHLPNIEVYNDWHNEGNVLLVPWMVGEEHKKLQKNSAQYLMGHFEIPNFKLNSQIVMPEIGEVKRDIFSNYGSVFSGHFHLRQKQGNITYIGNAFPHNFSDAWDDERGMMILTWGEEPVYHKWPDAPRYKTLNISDLVLDPDKYLFPKSYIKLSLDTDISYEEANYLKESLVKEYNIREISLLPVKKDSFADDLSQTGIIFESVDEIVTKQIAEIQSEHYDSNILLDIYRNL